MNTYIFICDIAYGTEESYMDYVQAKTLDAAVHQWTWTPDESDGELNNDPESIDHIIEIQGTPIINETLYYGSTHKYYPMKTKQIKI